MKLLTGILTFCLTFSAFALEKSAHLDFSKVYGNFNAGTYKVSVKLVPKTTMSKGTIEAFLDRNDNDFTCTTSATFEVGEMTFSIKRLDSSWEKTIVHKVYGSVSHEVPGTECDLSLQNLQGHKNLYIQVGLNNSSLVLPVFAPDSYEKVSAWLTPFAGYLYSEALVMNDRDVLKVNPALIFDEENLLPLNQTNFTKFYYYLTATKESSTLSLANGVVDFN